MTPSSRPHGFVGLGMMGYPMASRLSRAGFQVTAFDAAPAHVGKFVADNPGARSVDTLAAFSGLETVITMLPNSTIVESVVLGQADQQGLVDILPAKATLIDMSSSEPMRSRALAGALAKCGLHYLDAPVSGGVGRASKGTLAIMIGGDKAEFDRQYDVFTHLRSIITYVGGPGSGHALKALNNYVSAAGLVATAEALLVGEAFGLDPGVMTDVLNSSTGKNNTTEHKVKQFMLSGAFNSGFALQLMLKDLGTAMRLGDQLGWDMRLGQEVLRLWSTAASELATAADHTEMYRFLKRVEAPDSKQKTPTPSFS